jgi:sulfur carrier protein ThiS adenylyltransferase
MKIFVNEVLQEVNKNITAYQVKEKYKEDSDVLILNGYQISKDVVLKEDDKITLIKKGEVPSKEDSLMSLRMT